MLRDLRHPGKSAHSTYGCVRKRNWDFAPMHWFLQAWTKLWAAADPDPLSPFLSLPAATGHTPDMQAKGIQAALHSSELFPAMVYQCILTGRAWCSLLLTHSPPRRRHSSSPCTVFAINTQEKTLPAIFLNNRVLLSLLLPCKQCYCSSQKSLQYYWH